MQDDKNKTQVETDYELALRLAGFYSDGERLVETESSPAKEASFTPKKPDIRVNTLNKPHSILKKWYDASVENNKEKTKQSGLETTERDHFFNDQSYPKNFKQVFLELDTEPLLASDQRINLDLLDDEILKDEFSKSR